MNSWSPFLSVLPFYDLKISLQSDVMMTSSWVDEVTKWWQPCLYACLVSDDEEKLNRSFSNFFLHAIQRPSQRFRRIQWWRHCSEAPETPVCLFPTKNKSQKRTTILCWKVNGLENRRSLEVMDSAKVYGPNRLHTRMSENVTFRLLLSEWYIIGWKYTVF